MKSQPCRGLFAGAVLILSSLSLHAEEMLWTGGAGTNWNDAASWTPSGIPGVGDEVTIGAGHVVLLSNATAPMGEFVLESGATLICSGWDSALIATNLSIAGTVTHLPNMTSGTNTLGQWVPEHRILIQGSNLTLASTGTLDANYKGYRRMCGPGSPAPYGGNRGGAGHATDGGFSRGDSYSRGGFPYGDPATPEQPGSGGGYHSNSREGGGAVRIQLTGQLDIQGDILAEGRQGVYAHGPGGSGGSVWISANTLTGSAAGLITVNGGKGRTYAGGGAGGRIAIEYNPVDQAGLEPPSIEFRAAYGGTDMWSYFLVPTYGTLHLPDSLWLTETLTEQFNEVTLVVPGLDAWAPSSLTLDGAKLGFPPGFHLAVDQDLVLTNGGDLHLTAAPVDDPLTQDGALVEVGGSLRLDTGSWIHPYADPTNGATVAFQVTDDVTIAANAGFDANFKGYAFGYGPGVAPTIYGGAGYGGRGAMGPYGRRWGPACGDPSAPRQPGSGRAKSSDYKESPGGGAIRLTAGGDIHLDGELRANGTSEMSAHTCGGSGGGIHLVCRTLQGESTGLASVQGGPGVGSGGAGGGGRIAVHYDPAAQAALDDPIPGVRFSAYAPPSPSATYFSTFEAEMGTLYLPDPLWMTEVIDGDRFSSVRLIIPNWTSWAPDSLTISNTVFGLPEGFHLQVAQTLELGMDAELHLPAAATNETFGPFGARIDVGSDLVLRSGGWLHPAAHPTNGATVRIRVEGDVTIEAEGGIDAMGLGYHPGQGPGKPGNTTSGGSHGGLGAGAAPGSLYGRTAWPLHPGSPGGWRLDPEVPDCGFGGGAILLQAGQFIRLDGRLTAVAKRACYQTGTGTEGSGGSGGSILLLAGRRLLGHGTMDASGGLGFRNVSGGGGRIAVWPCLSLAAQDVLLEGAGGMGVPETDYSFFEGDLHVDSPEGTLISETAGEPGTYGFYMIRGTMIMVR